MGAALRPASRNRFLALATFTKVKKKILTLRLLHVNLNLPNHELFCSGVELLITFRR